MAQPINLAESSFDKQSIISKRKVWTLLIVVMFASVLLAGTFFFSIIHSKASAVTISGRVLSADTAEPLRQVMVAIESFMPESDETSGSFIRTDDKGRFSEKIRGKIFRISVWKTGYAMKALNTGQIDKDKEFVISLRRMTQTNWLKQNDNIFEIEPANAFSFALGKVVSDISKDADFLIKKDAENKNIAIIEACGDGGLIFQPYNENIDFFNTPEAPTTGYLKWLKFDPSQPGLYFFKTRDGKHYAKVWLNINLITSKNGESYLDFGMGTRLIWAYQTDGTRYLEIAPSKDLPFPFHKFGEYSVSPEN